MRLQRPSTAVLLLLLVGCTSAGVRTDLPPGQHPQAFEREITKTVRGRYLVFLPKDYAQTSQRWPMILFLHGVGERGDSLDLVKLHGPPKLVQDREDFPFIVVSPQAPSGEVWSPDVLTGLLDEVLAKFPIDPDRIYLTGLSMGGYGAWALAIEHPERFAAVVPISGGGNPARVCALKDLPVWAFHGARDSVVLPRQSEQMVQALQACGGRVTLTIYPDATHDAWTRTYANPDLYEWLLQHRRQRP